MTLQTKSIGWFISDQDYQRRDADARLGTVRVNLPIQPWLQNGRSRDLLGDGGDVEYAVHLGLAASNSKGVDKICWFWLGDAASEQAVPAKRLKYHDSGRGKLAFDFR